MSQRDKLRAKILARPPQMRYSEVRNFLEFEGWTPRDEEGSHVTFKKKGHRSITLSKVGGKMVPRYQLDQICEILGLDG